MSDFEHARVNRDRYTLYEPVGPTNPTPEEETWRLSRVAGPKGTNAPEIELARERALLGRLLQEVKEEAAALRKEAAHELSEARDTALRLIREAAQRSIQEVTASASKQ